MPETPNQEVYSDPEVITLSEQLNTPIEELDNITPLPYPGFIAQDEYRAVELPILASEEEINKMLIDKGLTEEDRRKYISIVEKIDKDKKLGEKMIVEMRTPNLENILKFCTAAMWLITGRHDEEGAQSLLFASATGIRASILVDLESPPITKCNFFNSAFVYLFEAACQYFKRQDILSKYQLIAVKRRTHWYPALVSKYKGTYRISAIDPYHTSWREKIDTKGIDPETLFKILDRTTERKDELIPAYWNSINWRDNT